MTNANIGITILMVGWVAYTVYQIEKTLRATRKKKNRQLRVYVASSWRNAGHDIVVRMLEQMNCEVYNYRKPFNGDPGFNWPEISISTGSKRENLKALLSHPKAEKGFKTDFDAMKWADVFVGIMPFGVSASLEMGWASGQGKPTILLLDSDKPELMTKLCSTHIFDLNELHREIMRLQK